MDENIYDMLSDQEDQILKMAEMGFTNHQMAARLNIPYSSLGMMKSKMRAKGVTIVHLNRDNSLTEDKKEIIIKMNAEGKRDLDIARFLLVKYSTLCYWKNKMKAEGIVFVSSRIKRNPF